MTPHEQELQRRLARMEMSRRRQPRPIFRRSMTDVLDVVVIQGMPGCGKSEAARREIMETVTNQRFMAPEDENQVSILVAEPHGGLGDSVRDSAIEAGLEDQLEWIDLADLHRIVGLDIMPYPMTQVLADRIKEAALSVERVAQVLVRERNINLNTAPYTGTWTRNALKLRMFQDQPCPLRFVPYALMPGHPIQLYMLRHCTDAKLRYEFELINNMTNLFQRENIIGPAKRLLEPVFGNICFDAMLSAPPEKMIRLGDWFRRKRLIIVRADPSVDPATTRAFLGMLFVLMYQECALHQARTGKMLRVRSYWDEFARLRPGEMEADFLEQGRKWGCQPRLIFQRIKPEQEFLLNCASELQVFAMGTEEAADLAARQIATLTFDPRREKSVEYRQRNITTGHHRDVVRTDSWRRNQHGEQDGFTTSEHIVTTPEQDVVTDRFITYETPQEWLLEVKRDIMKLADRVGWRIVVRRGQTTGKPEYVEQWRKSCLDDETRRQALARIQARPCYHTPDFQPPQAPREAPVAPRETAPVQAAQEQPTSTPRNGRPRRDAASRLRDGEI